jgi:hypothetical protein
MLTVLANNRRDRLLSGAAVYATFDVRRIDSGRASYPFRKNLQTHRVPKIPTIFGSA